MLSDRATHKLKAAETETTRATYEICDERASKTLEAESFAAAVKRAEEWLRKSVEFLEVDPEDKKRTLWLSCVVRELDDAGDETESLDVSVAINPTPPDCTHEDGHDWRDDYDIVGGSWKSPGVYGHGAGHIYYEVCVHCGCGKRTDTYATDPDTGEQGLTSIEYDPDPPACAHAAEL